MSSAALRLAQDAYARRQRGGEPRGNDEQFGADFPMFAQVGATGASRYTPTLRADAMGRVYVYWYDSITLEEYDEMRMDGQIKAGLTLIKLPVQRMKWNVTCADEDIAAFVSAVLKPVWNDLIRQALLGLEFGFSVFEKIWSVSYGLRVAQTQGNLDAGKERVYPHALVLKRLMQLDPKTIWLLGYRRSGEFAGINQYTPNDVKIPASKAFIYTHEKEFGELYGVSRLKPAFPYWWYCKCMYEQMGVFYQDYTIPPRKARFPVGQSVVSKTADGTLVYRDNAEIALEWAESLKADSAVAVPSDVWNKDQGSSQSQWDIEYMEAARTGGDHLAVIDHYQGMKLKSILVPQLALETGASGNFSLAESQINFFMKGEAALADDLVASVNTQIVDQIVRYNFGPNAPQARIEVQPMTDAMEEGLREVFMQTIGQGRPIPLADGNIMVPDWGWMSEHLGIPTKILKGDEADAYLATDKEINPPPPAVGPDGQPIDPNGGQGSGDMPFGGGPGGGSGGASQGTANTGGKNYGGNDAAGSQPGGGSFGDEANLSEDQGDWAVAGGELVWLPLAA